jgi:hypothetical protein
LALFGISLISILFVPNVIAEEAAIPGWVKNNAGWWADGQIPDSAFLQGIQFLIKEGIMVIPPTETSEYSESKVPAWIKNNASWWADGHIDDNTFVSGIQYLVKVGIIVDPINEIKKLADEYWCYHITRVTSDCIARDKDKHAIGIEELVDISGYWVDNSEREGINSCDIDCNLSLNSDYDVDEKLEKFQDEDLHKQLFDIFVSITPKQILDEVVYLHIFTDDYGSQAAMVNRDSDYPLKFGVGIDPLDMAPSAGPIDIPIMKAVMIHEGAHILSLSSSQSDNDLVGEEWKEEIPQKAAICAPNYYTYFSGCMNSNSYLNLFFQEFWVDIYPNFKWSYEFDDDDQFNDHNALFHQKYKTQFMTPYAATNPNEDFAESFTTFVLTEKPSYHSSVLRHGDALIPTKETADKKIRFFYDFPELVEMRDFIRNNL